MRNSINKVKQNYSVLHWNVDPYIALAKLVVNEQIILDENEEAQFDDLTNFDQENVKILVSNWLKQDTLSQSKFSVILYNEEKFKSIALSPLVLLDKVKITSIRDQQEETLRKFKKIDKNMKEIYKIKINFSLVKNIILSEWSQ